MIGRNSVILAFRIPPEVRDAIAIAAAKQYSPGALNISGGS